MRPVFSMRRCPRSPYHGAYLAGAIASLLGFIVLTSPARALSPPGPGPGPEASGLGVSSTPATEIATGRAARRPGPAYWLAGADGGVFGFGRGAYAGGLASRPTNARVTALAPTPSGNGYWLAGADGGVFAFGDASWKGSVPSGTARGPIVAIAATPTGKGYWLAGADGGVFAFGDATFHGSVSSLHLNAPIVAIAATPTGKGYWLAGADGGVYAFGDALLYGHAAGVYGSATGLHLNQPVVAIASTPSGSGYWLAAADGAVLAFGDAPYAGGLTDQPHWGPVVGIARTRSGAGYWLASSDGGVFSFGDARYYGSVGGAHLNGPVAAIASGDGTALPVTPTSPGTALGFDISWPQCGNQVPAPPYSFGVVGVTGGHLFSANPCLRQQWRWATAHGSFAGLYLNANAFSAADLRSFLSGAGARCGADVGCALYAWGRQGVAAALSTAGDLPAPRWWLDVETANEWLPDPAANAVILQGMIEGLQAAGKKVGIYSTALQFGRIAGDFHPAVPTWVAGVPAQTPLSWCEGHSFGGGETWLVQTDTGLFDPDLLCPAGAAHARDVFAAPAPVPVPEYAAPVVSQRKEPVVQRALDALGVPGPAELRAATWAASHAAGVAEVARASMARPSGTRGFWAWVGVGVAALMMVGLAFSAWRPRANGDRLALGGGKAIGEVGVRCSAGGAAARVDANGRTRGGRPLA